ncbi:MAG: Hint domain-containing protein [Tranquillimonas sp.]|jgi:hypothetical protein
MSFFETIDTTRIAPLTGVSGEALMRTPAGLKRAEFIRPGDMLVTRSRGLQTVRLIWKRVVGADEMRHDADTVPVRLAARALGPMMPSRPMMLAPAHRVLVPAFMLARDAGDGGLVEARALAGGSDAAWRDRAAEGAVFYNFVFDRHEVICASGVPVESFHVTARAAAEVDEVTRHALLLRFPMLRQAQDAFPPAAYPMSPAEDYVPALV